MLRAVREARGVTLDGWGARLGVSRTTVQRWERGERAPDPGAEAAIIAYCRDMGLLRAYDHGPLAGLVLTAELLQDLIAQARLGLRSGPADAAPPSAPVRSVAPEQQAGAPPQSTCVLSPPRTAGCWTASRPMSSARIFFIG